MSTRATHQEVSQHFTPTQLVGTGMGLSHTLVEEVKTTMSALFGPTLSVEGFSANKQAMARTAALDDKSASLFHAESSDLPDNIDVLSRSIATLEKGVSGSSFFQSHVGSVIRKSWSRQRRSTRAPSVDVSPRSPKSPRSRALLSYSSSPTGSGGLSTGIRLPLTPRSPVEVDISSPRSLFTVSSPVRTSPVFARAERDFDAEH